MKIYTKGGDQGTTGLFSGTRISKSDVRLHAYGTLDELNAHVGLLRDQMAGEYGDRVAELLQVQHALFAIGSHMANDAPEMVSKLPAVDAAWTAAIESAIDTMDQDLAPMRQFILPGGHVMVSQAHVARTVARRAERWVSALHAELADGDLPLPEATVPYLNRLSDYFFALSRWLSVQLGATETPWAPNK